MKGKRLIAFVLITMMLFGSLGSYATGIIPAEKTSEELSEEVVLESVYESEDGTEDEDVLTEDKSGKIASGDIEWTVTTEGMLTLKGKGKLESFDEDDAPWSKYAEYVKFIYISDGISEIGSYAFSNLSKTTSVYIPESVTVIKKNAFDGCNSVVEFSLPDTVREIEEYAFASCSSVKTITIPEDAIHVSPLAFSNCEGLTEILVSDKNDKFVSIEGILFDIDETTLISYPDGREDITYSVPEGVKTIGENAFDYCANLTEIILPESLENIESRAFYQCSSIEILSIPEGVMSIAQDAILYGMSSLKEINVDEENKKYASENGLLYNKNKTTLIRVPAQAVFPGNDWELAQTLTVIGQEAFYENQSKISRLQIHAPLKKIEMAAFMNCTNIRLIKYNSTKDNWEHVKKGLYNDILYDINIKFLDGEVQEDRYKLTAGVTYYLKDYVNIEEYKELIETAVVSSSNPNVAAVDTTKLVAVSLGEALITATVIKDGAAAAVAVWVDVEEGNDVDKTGHFEFYLGETKSLLNDLLIHEEYVKELTWATLDTNVAIVENGVVTAVSEGETKVVASLVSTSGKKFSVSCNVVVKAKYTNESYFDFSKGVITKYTGPDTIVKIPKEIGGVPVTAIGNYAFSDCTYVTEIKMPETVKSIGTKAFYNCAYLSDITLHEGITTIGNYAFENCSSLVKVDIPSTITSDSLNVFRGCKRLTTVTFAEGTLKIGRMLSNLNTLQSVTIPSTVTEIGDNAFYNCTVLYSVNIPANVTKIGYSAFRNCYKLTSATIGNKVTDLGSFAFYDCSKLASVKLGTGLKIIKDYTFHGCSSLSEVTIPKNITTIGKYAFAWCSKLTKATLAKGVKNIGESAFMNCYKLTTVSIPTTVTTIGMFAFQQTSLTNIVIPDSVTSIGTYAFAYCKNLANVTLGAGLKTIGTYAFYNSRITEVAIPDSVTEVGNYAFASCTSLANATIGSGVSKINRGTFSGCVSLKEIVWSEDTKVKRIEEYAFSNSGLEKIEIPDSVTVLNVSVFNNCTKLKDVKIGGNIKNISSSLFTGCSSITTVELSEGVETIGDNAFRNCEKLISIKIPNTVTKIGSYAFANCRALKEIEIPDSVTSIGNYAFYYCWSLKSVKLSSEIKSIPEYCFYDCYLIKNIEIPDSVESIGVNAFAYCYDLKTIEIPSSVKAINSYAFYSCTQLNKVTFNEGLKSIGIDAFGYLRALKEIVLPDSLTTINSYAFEYCTALTNITLGENIETIYNSAFYGCRNLVFTGGIPSSLVRYIINNNMFGNGEMNIIYKNFNKQNTGYRATNETMLGYIPMELSYELKSNISASNMNIYINVPLSVEIMDGTVKLDGVTISNHTITDNGNNAKTLRVPVKNRSGVITFCIKPSEYQKIATYAEMTMYVSGKGSTTEFLGYVNCSTPEISVAAPDIVSSSTVTVEGLTLPRKTVKFYIDGVYQKSYPALANGTYKTAVTLPTTENFKTYVIKAEVENGGEIFTSETEVLYLSDAPQLTGLKMIYEMGDYYRTRRNTDTYDLFNAKTSLKVQWGDYWTGNNYVRGTSRGYNYSYRVNISGNSNVDKVYVVSTRNNVKSYLEAKWNSKKGYYETSGFFDGNNQYMPGSITVEYTQKGREKSHEVSYNKEILNFQTGDFKPNINEYTKDSFDATVDVSDEFKDDFGGKMKVKSSAHKKEHNEEDDHPNKGKHNYHSFDYEKHGKKHNLSFDLTDSGNAILYYRDLTEGREVNYEMSFFDVDSEGFEIYNDIDEIIEKANSNSKFKKILKAYNLDIDIEKLKGDVARVFDSEEDLNEAAEKIEALKVKKNMLLLTLMVLSASSYENISASTEIIDSILDSIEEEMAYFRQHKLVNLFEIGKSYKINWKIDPSGYVFEGVTDNRLKDVTATINCIEIEKIPTDEKGNLLVSQIEDGAGTPWDAVEYDQINPLLTDENGDYRWDVPEGYYWQVKYEKEGYETAYSEWMPVPPIQTDVNIGLVSKAAPKVEKIHLTTDYMTITFDKFMDPETLADGVDVGGASYTLDYDKEKVDLNGKCYANEIIVKFDSPLNAGVTYDVSIEGAKSYADVEMEKYNVKQATDGEALPSELIIKKTEEKDGVVKVYYINNTGKTLNFTTVLTGYDKDGKVADVKILGTYGLETGVDTVKEFELEGNWESHKVFTWSEDDSLAPIIEAK